MGLRDYFASHERSYPPNSWVHATYGSEYDSFYDLPGVYAADALSRWRYQVADAMLAEREK